MPRFYETLFPAWFFFYYLGLWVKINGAEIIMAQWNVAVALLFCIGEAFTLQTLGTDIGFTASQIRFGSFLYAYTLICYFLKIRENRNENSILTYIGDRSYGIYYVHCFILIFARKICSVAGLERIWIVDFIGCFVIALLGSLLVIEGVRWGAKKLKIARYLRWIGFD